MHYKIKQFYNLNMPIFKYLVATTAAKEGKNE